MKNNISIIGYIVNCRLKKKKNETIEKIGYKITINLSTVCFKEITHLM